MPTVISKPRRVLATPSTKVALAAVGALCACYGPAAFAPAAAPRGTIVSAQSGRAAIPTVVHGAAAATVPKAGVPSAAALGGVLVSAAVVASAARRGLSVRRTSTKQRRSALAAAPDAADAIHQFQEWVNNGGLEELQRHLPHLPPHAFDFVPPANAEEAAKEVAKEATAPVLDPNVKYLYGADGNVLIDPQGNRPLADDWWNGFVGIQKDAIVGIDAKLRELGLKQSFGWTIVLYTFLLKVAFYPLQQGALRTSSMMQLLQPKVKEIQAMYKDDQETQSRLLTQLYGSLDVNPLGGCLPTLVQLPIFWSLYGVWRRLYSEKYEFYSERWLWVPNLSKPNPDFQFKFDWLADFVDGAPRMGWTDYLCYLVFPAILIASTVLQTQQSQAQSRTDDSNEQPNMVLQILPFVSVYLIGTLSLELPQAVSIYYTMNNLLTQAQTQLVKWTLRQDIPGYDEFEKTGKFPDSSFEDLVKAATPPPKTVHEAALRGNLPVLRQLCEEGNFDINAWDDKQITPLGYAVACGHTEVARDLLARGGKIDVLDGQNNTLLHYAAGYGHLETLKELLEAGKEVWPNDEWAEVRNMKGQTVPDCARVNNKGAVLEFLGAHLGVEFEALAEPEVIPSSTGGQATITEAEGAAAARAVLLAATGTAPDAGEAEPVPVSSSGGQAQQATVPETSAETAAKFAVGDKAAFEQMMVKLKDNPEAVEKARSLISKLPPNILANLTGGKMSEDQAKAAMERMQNMSTQQILDASQVAATAAGGMAASPVSAVAASESESQPKQKVAARAVD